MKSRLEVAKDLLAKDGSIWINIDDIEAHYLKVLCDEMFGRDNFIANIVWQKKFSPQNDAKYFSDNHDHILVYAKSRQSFKSNLLPRSDASASRYSNPDDDTRGPWTSGDLTVKTYSAEYDYPVKTPSGKVINPTKGRCWAVSKRRFQELVADNRIWFGKNGGNVPRMKMFLSEVKEGQTPLTIWLHTDVGHNQEAKQEVNKLLEKDLFKTPKPERLIKRIIDIGSNEGDIIFDFFLGSGTTAAVALKMGRKFISCEQMDYVKSVTLVRLKKVLQGEQGGISKSVNWQGGGSFIYCELAKANQEFVDIIAKTKTAKELRDIWSTMQEKAFISYKVDIKDINKYSDNFDQLSVEDQKRFLVEILDKNHLYVNFSEIEDKDYKLSKDDKALSYKLYSLK
jgi:adenine-specific DNA-methyltransferase